MSWIWVWVVAAERMASLSSAVVVGRLGSDWVGVSVIDYCL